MCIVLVAHACCPGYRLVVAANRDEFHRRPTAPAAWWDGPPGILAGRDLESHGTWLGVTASARFATVTNVRSGGRAGAGERSRGLLVSDFLRGSADAPAFVETLAASATSYDGFNLLAYDGRALSWLSNQGQPPRHLPRGIYTVSNAALDTPWPKTTRLRDAFERVVASATRDGLVEDLLTLLRDGERAPADALPDTGVGRAMEHLLSAIFIEGDGYGTRCSSVLAIGDDDRVTFHERRYDATARPSGDSRFEFAAATPHHGHTGPSRRAG